VRSGVARTWGRLGIEETSGLAKMSRRTTKITESVPGDLLFRATVWRTSVDRFVRQLFGVVVLFFLGGIRDKRLQLIADAVRLLVESHDVSEFDVNVIVGTRTFHLVLNESDELSIHHG